MSELSAEAHARIEARLRRLMPRQARFAYFQEGNGPMFVWNTERIATMYPTDPANGKFESAVFVPYGPGSRSGKARNWKVLDGSRSLHELRRDAKARAERLFDAWRVSGKVEL